MSRITTDSYGFSPRRFPPIPLAEFPEPDRFIICTCDTVEITVKEPECTGDWMKPWCVRALKYNRDAGGFLSDRVAYGLTGAEFGDGPVCDTSGFTETGWFFDPSAPEVTDWLAAMTLPPLPGWILKVTLFFECYRGMFWYAPDGVSLPCDASSETSLIILRGICYGRQD